MTSNTPPQTTVAAFGDDQVPVLLVEDDDGDAQAEQDILRSYSLHANAYISKPVGFQPFIDAIRQIDTFFLNLVKLPA